eukprot:bmy_08942T0
MAVPLLPGSRVPGGAEGPGEEAEEGAEERGPEAAAGSGHLRGPEPGSQALGGRAGLGLPVQVRGPGGMQADGRGLGARGPRGAAVPRGCGRASDATLRLSQAWGPAGPGQGSHLLDGLGLAIPPAPAGACSGTKGGTGRNRDRCPGEPWALCWACRSPREQPFGSAGISERAVPSSWGPAPVKICPPPCRKHAFDSVPPSPPREVRLPSSPCRGHRWLAGGGHRWLAGGGHVEPSGRGGPACALAEGAARQPPLTLGLALGCVQGVGGTGVASRPLVDTWSRPGTFHLQLRCYFPWWTRPYKAAKRGTCRLRCHSGECSEDGGPGEGAADPLSSSDGPAQRSPGDQKLWGAVASEQLSHLGPAPQAAPVPASHPSGS